MPPLISDYYRAALEQLKGEVESTPDDQVLGMDVNQWVDYLVQKYGMETIDVDDSRSPEMVEVDHEHTLRGYDIYSDRGPGTVVRTTKVRVEVPVVPSDTLREIWKHGLAPNSFSLVKYPEFDYDDRRGIIHTVVGTDGADVSALDADILTRVGSKLGPGLSPEKLLQQLDLADYDRGVVRLRRAALLLFAREPRRWHPRSEIRILRISGVEMKAGPEYNVVKDQVVTGPILALMSAAWDALRYYLVQTKFGPGGLFEERILYPEDACLEALTNAIAHRDYATEGRGIEILVFDDRMEVRSPGSLLSNVTLDDLIKARGVHQSRNSLSRTPGL